MLVDSSKLIPGYPYCFFYVSYDIKVIRMFFSKYTFLQTEIPGLYSGTKITTGEENFYNLKFNNLDSFFFNHFDDMINYANEKFEAYQKLLHFFDTMIGTETVICVKRGKI